MYKRHTHGERERDLTSFPSCTQWCVLPKYMYPQSYISTKLGRTEKLWLFYKSHELKKRFSQVRDASCSDRLRVHSTVYVSLSFFVFLWQVHTMLATTLLCATNSHDVIGRRVCIPLYVRAAGQHSLGPPTISYHTCPSWQNSTRWGHLPTVGCGDRQPPAAMRRVYLIRLVLE